MRQYQSPDDAARPRVTVELLSSRSAPGSVTRPVFNSMRQRAAFPAERRAPQISVFPGAVFRAAVSDVPSPVGGSSAAPQKRRYKNCCRP